MKEVLITSSVLILAVAALRPLLRGRIDPLVQYALWLTVALRLLLPVNFFTSAYSAPALLERAQQPGHIVQAIGQASLPAQSYDSARAQVMEDYRQRGVEEVQLTPADLMSIDAEARQLMRGPTLAELFQRYARPVWLGGAAVMAAWFLLVNLALRRKLRGAKRLNGVDCPLPVYVSDALPSPCLCGALRPAVYVVPAALESSDRMRHVLAHELAHFRHRDHWWALIRCALLCAYWFDPLVWWAAALSRQDCELACDAGAIRALGEEERIPYGRTLVGMIAAGRTSLMQTATTMTGGRRKIRERVKLIARKPKTVIALALAAALLLGLAVGCAFSGAPENTKTLDNLQERLEDIPEDLANDVLANTTDRSENPPLASYWMNRDWRNYDDGTGWLLNVIQQSYEEFLQSLSLTTSNSWVCFARSGDTYFAINCDDSTPPLEDAEAFYNAYRDIRAYAMQQVLETEGVEPYTAPGHLSANTLQARLENIPQELRGEVISHPWPSMPTGLADYWLDGATDWDSDSAMGWLVSVRQWDQAQFEDWLNNGEPGNFQVFARDSSYYYAFMWPTGVEYDLEDAQRYAAAQQAIRAFAEQTVLETEGVEPYGGQPAQSTGTLQSRLMDVPEEWRDKLADPDPIQEPGCLAYYWLDDPKWTDLWGGWLLTLYRLDEDVIQRNLDQQRWPAVDIFARSGNEYYVILWASDDRYQNGSDLSNEYWAAVNAMKDHVTATVLDTEGVEPFDPYTTPPHFFSNVPQPSIEPGGYAIEGMDYTLVTSYEQVPEDPERWYLVGQMPGYPVWMFTRGSGEETMFQVEDQLTQVFPYRARFFRGGYSPDGHAPQFLPLEGFGWGPKGTFGPFAVITHLFQGGTDQEYQLTVYDLEAGAVTPYVHDWRPLMEDFNATCTTQVHPDRRAVSFSYQGQTAEIQFESGDPTWASILENGTSAQVYEYVMDYVFSNHDGTATLRMPCNHQYTACWTVRFTGNGFETTGFQFERIS